MLSRTFRVNYMYEISFDRGFPSPSVKYTESSSKLARDIFPLLDGCCSLYVLAWSSSKLRLHVESRFLDKQSINSDIFHVGTSNVSSHFSHITRQAQYEHPCYPHEMQAVRVVSPPRHTHFHSHSVLVPANPYLNEEIPHWLYVYSRASIALDRKLRWELFRLPELDCFNAMLTRLYKQELEEVVMRYEEYRYSYEFKIEDKRITISFLFL